ncbi:TetR/AcrR family transcriptional regulator [Streptomyces sp. SID13726]|uniref:TetR/AcrR family transcriptional regulator n=1 Tax=Streptomyces sp. SID13726 TaxID=2706058 RepID=UPI0013BB0FC2|nr:TetR/AcrR family transcriptional regulator [Streptomyces sp. SID13726]NEA99614.1 TetR/AcrR family transcriptional regulator [Streptomyces sp. SID13726]
MTTASEPHPKDRLLRTASRLFYAEGIQAVGIDRLVTEAKVTRATFYRHYPSKDDLVSAYLTATAEDIRAAVAQAREGKPPREAVRAVMAVLGDATLEDGFRGCQFLNAAAEYPDRTHPVRAVIDDQRTWLFGVLRDLSAAIGHPEPDHAARVLVMLHDGAFQSAELDDATAVRETLRRAVDQVFPAEGD